MKNGVYTAKIGKAALQFDLEYHTEESQLTLWYPAGATVEAAKPYDPFEGYTVIEPGVEVKMFNTFRIILNGSFSGSKSRHDGNATVGAEMVNILKRKLNNFSDELPHPYLHYVNEDGNYTYRATYNGYGNTLGWTTSSFSLEPLVRNKVLLVFDLPNTVLNDRDPSSVFAITFEKSGSSEKYVLFLDR